jgi:hypothetical protein
MIITLNEHFEDLFITFTSFQLKYENKHLFYHLVIKLKVLEKLFLNTNVL